jgi:hypothetical protein
LMAALRNGQPFDTTTGRLIHKPLGKSGVE